MKIVGRVRRIYNRSLLEDGNLGKKEVKI